MRPNEEIFSVRFNKVLLKDDMHVTTYTLGVPILGTMEVITPEKIELIEDKLITTFSNKTKHIISYTSDVEIFIREKEKKKDGADTKRKGRPRKSK